MPESREDIELPSTLKRSPEHAQDTYRTDLARRLEIRGRSRMTKPELVDAVTRENRRRLRTSRERGA
jgi:hypothetical protein